MAMSRIISICSTLIVILSIWAWSLPAIAQCSTTVWSCGTNGANNTPTTVMSTEMNSLAAGGNVTSSVNGSSGVFNQSTVNFLPYGRCWVTLGGALGGTASAGANFSIWFLVSTDGGTTFESTTVSPPPRSPDIVIPVGASAYGSGAILMSPPDQRLWSESVKVVVQDNTGQALASSGNTVKCGAEPAVGVGGAGKANGG